MAYVVEAHELVKTYRMGEVEVHALNGLNLRIAKGAFVSVMGPSGSGKSTLLNVLGCMDRPSSGTILVDGVELGRAPRKHLPRIRREKLGFVFQQYHLLGHMTALENVMLPLRYTNVGQKEARRRATELLARVGLGDRVHHRPLEMSGGQQQRVAVARALINHPAIILADEPTGNLDSKSGDEIMDLLQALNANGQTIIAVTHDPRVAERTGRTIILRDGCVVDEVIRDQVGV
ncbi:MAG: ABC transporter ATP-binding protein [Anaerolineae bacterium]|nr:ABC transporter ATP-binding protein [Anaerolineae bacterium]